MTRRPPLWLSIIGVVVAAWLIVPTLVVIPIGFSDRDSFRLLPAGWSLDYYTKFFTDPRWTGSLMDSLTIAALVAVTATMIGTLAALCVPTLGPRARSFASAVIVAPMLVPHVVIAVGLYSVFLSWRLVGTVQGFVLAHTVIAIPFVFITVSAALSGIDRRLAQAAATLGAPAWRVFLRVTLPLLAPGIVSGALFAFVTSLDEVIIAIYLQSPTLRTLPVQLYTSVTANIDPTVAAASTIVMIVTTAAILGPQLLRRRAS
ncbi:ABC transporter permease subunit [Rathayibacter sp. VKM Ac-2804]|uniref:ABC transporter permease n=1 Tax=Rathayibacter sp. VKM Ac-2804 TaxID=2609257 RepID=UPI00132EBC3F|nr:ABC transporter permease [Rathayibacter sp. VKM Ac-2804]QHF24552.1 ABC transporter permease subunit [Rathayibacter sp. VKM Ac-2804]